MTSKLQITFAVPGMPFNGDTPYEKSLGGSETAAWALARTLAKRGHRIRVFSNLPEGADGTVRPGMFDGVQYWSLRDYELYRVGTPHDVCVIQRIPEMYSGPTAAKFNVLWCHDLALGRDTQNFRSVLWNIDRVFVVSQYMKDQYVKVHELDEAHNLIHATRNGVFLDDVPAPGTVERNKFRLVFGARPERGLDTLLERILPELMKDERITVALTTYDNPTDHLAAFYRELAQKAAAFGDRVRFVGNLDKRSLYELFSASGLYIYPTPSAIAPGFMEVSCISAMEAQACGLPIVSSNRGALPETIHPDAGRLIDGDSFSDEYRDAFVGAVRRYLDDPSAYEAASVAGRIHAERLTWDGVADDWEAEIGRMFMTLNDDVTRLAYHFYRRNDIMPLQHLIGREERNGLSPALSDLAKRVDKEYAFTRGREAFTKHYRDGGLATTARLETYPIDVHNFATTDESRFHKIEEMITRYSKKVENDDLSILDYGCGHGWGTIYFHNRMGHRWQGIDVDDGAIMWARRFADYHARDASKLTFHVGDHGIFKRGTWDATEFDVVLCSEVLEHCVDPKSVAEALERRAKKDSGLVLFTVPYGASEFGSPNWDTFRNHIWDFSIEQLYDLFGKKADLNINATVDHLNPVNNESVGYYTVSYTADHEPLGDMNLDNHMAFQRPRQTLSIILMAGPGAETSMEWCLSSVKWLADEIIIADCGMSDEAKRIAARYSARLVPSPSPLDAGFFAPRNVGLDAARMDWVLWIDTDERVTDAHFLVKYLRQSFWQGIGIRQHHFAVDTTFPADMPIRLFRRAPFAGSGVLNGKVMRFHGWIHEHPELVMNEGPGPVLIVPDINIAHVGYLSEFGRRVKFHRNLPMLMLDREHNPDRILQKYFIMRDNMLLISYEMQSNGRVATPEILERAREVVALYRQYFLGKGSFVNIDPTPHYTNALRILGEGIDVSFSFAANRDGRGDAVDANNSLRFGSTEEAVTELGRRIKDRLGALDKPTW